MHSTWLSHKINLFLKRERQTTTFDFVRKHAKSTTSRVIKDMYQLSCVYCYSRNFTHSLWRVKKIRRTEDVMSVGMLYSCKFNFS
jgi:hypothetical protein